MIESTLTESQVTWIVSGIALVLATILMLYYRRAKGLLDEMWAVDTYDAAELRRMCSSGFNPVIEVQGDVTCESPLTAPASNLPCAWCRTRVDREVERVQASRSGMSTQRSWENCFDRTITTLFKVNDSTGYTLVDPMNSQIDTEDPYTFVTMQREPWFEVSVGYSQTGRYRVREEIFVPTGYVYVLGQASTCQEGPNGDALIHYPSEGYTDPGRRFFIISRKSEKDLTSTNELSLKVCFWAAVVGFMFAAYCAFNALGIAP